MIKVPYIIYIAIWYQMMPLIALDCPNSCNSPFFSACPQGLLVATAAWCGLVAVQVLGFGQRVTAQNFQWHCLDLLLFIVV